MPAPTRSSKSRPTGPTWCSGLPTRFGMGYGLSNETMPIGPRACYWGGYGGSLIVIDQDKDVAVAYVMNRMESGVVGDERGATILQETMKALG